MGQHNRPPRQTGISFYEEDLLALQELDPNETYVPIARLCERLGLDAGAEERRVRKHQLLASAARSLQVEAGNRRETQLGLRVDLIPLWLTTLDASAVAEELRPRLELYQLESASVLWQSFRPQGFSNEDALLPDRFQQSPAEQAYAGAMAQATLSRHQMLIERQIDARRASRDPQAADPYAPDPAMDDVAATRLAQAVRRVAHTLAERSRRNEYAGIFSGLFRQFGIASYRRMAPGRLYEALEWLDRWRGDLMGEPEPPPDI